MARGTVRPLSVGTRTDRRYYPSKPTALVAESYSRFIANSNSVWTDGQLFCTTVTLDRPALVTNIISACSVLGVAITHAQGAIYALDGQTQYAATADTAGDRTAFQTTGLKTIAVVTPVTLQPGDYLVGFVFTATTTDPSLQIVTPSSALAGSGIAPRLCCQGAGSYTAVPATFTPVDSNRAYYYALS